MCLPYRVYPNPPVAVINHLTAQIEFKKAIDKTVLNIYLDPA